MTTIVRQRARKQPADVRREEVLDAAVRVFARESFRGAGTAEIAREAGIAEPTIYRHFSSKRDLYIAALRRCCEVVGTAFKAAADQHEDALDAMLAMIEWYDRSIREDPAYLSLRMRAEGETNDEDVRECLATGYAGLIDLMAGLVLRGQKQGVFRKQVSPEGVAWMFMAMGQVQDLTYSLGMDGDRAQQCSMALGSLYWEMLTEPAHMPRVLAQVQRWTTGDTA
ncbi:MAG: TetR/AcrR family transcriptional regulator [Dehalococcoidia bacterium]